MTGRRYAQVGVVFGLGVSTWANVAQAWPHGWGARLMAAVWPSILYLSLEVLARTAWAGKGGKWASRCAAGVVGLVAAILSYQHLRDLLLTYGEGSLSAALGPLGIDGLMAVCAAALLTKPADEPAPAPVVEPVAEAKPEPTEKPRQPIVKANGHDKRAVDIAAEIRSGLDPSINSLTKRYKVSWSTAKRLHDEAKALAGVMS